MPCRSMPDHRWRPPMTAVVGSISIGAAQAVVARRAMRGREGMLGAPLSNNALLERESDETKET